MILAASSGSALRIASVCFLALCLNACQHTSERLVLSSKPAVELRAMQSRAFDTTDQAKMMRAIVATLQDLGYKIDKIEPAAGSVSATKLASLRITASIYPRGTTQLIVRSNAQVKLLQQQQQQQNVETQVDDPEFYQKYFFEPLSKAVFLTALHIEDDPSVTASQTTSPSNAIEPATTP